MIYKDRVVFLRNNLGITQKEVANYLKIDTKHYGNCEREYELFPIKHLNNICKFLDVSLDYIFSFTDIKNYELNRKSIDKKLSGTRIKELRRELKLTQTDLANILKSGRATIANYENGTYIIALPFLFEICKKYNISADYLLGKVDNPKYLK